MCPQPTALAVLPNNWGFSGNHLIYRGHQRDLPAFLPLFAIPLPQAWFGALFTRHTQQGVTVYTDNAYLVATGYIVYSRVEAYRDGAWRNALKNSFFAVQVEWAEKTDTMPKRARAGAALQVAVFGPNAARSHLETQRRLGTTQQRFLAFLKSGNLQDLAPQHTRQGAA
jgi:hypothetical protein